MHFALVIANIVALVSAQVKACHNPARSVHNLNIHSKDRGCTAPGCDVPAYFTEVHHVTDYAKCRTTDVNDLTLACGTNHRIVRPGGWQTRKRKMASPNGFHHRTSTAASPASTCSITPKNCSGKTTRTTKKTIREGRPAGHRDRRADHSAHDAPAAAAPIAAIGTAARVARTRVSGSGRLGGTAERTSEDSRAMAIT